MRAVSAERTAGLLGDAPSRSPAYLSIAERLRLLVTDGRIPAGTRLPSERELTAALGVSRTTVTRAYSRLREEGYLVSRQGSGTLAQLPSAGSTTDQLLNPEPSSPGTIDLTCASPTAPAGIAAAYQAALTQLPGHLPEFGYYPSGLPALRAAIARRYVERGLPTDPEQVIVTSGALSALAVVVRAFVDAGDRVLTESPTYPNAVATLRGAKARVAGAHIDQSGWATSSLVDAAAQLRPATAYLMPDFHNPTGLLMSDAERGRLAAALRRSRTVPIVDETLAEMAIDEVTPPLPFAAHAPTTITIGSASKAFWGGLRIGWIRAPEPRIGPLVAARLTLDLGAPVLEQLALVHLTEQRAPLLALRRAQLAESRAALVGALAARLPSWRFRVPAGGLSLWCELPKPVSTALVAAAGTRGVRLAAGPLFAPEGGLEHFLRIPFTQRPELLLEAVDRLAKLWAEGVPCSPLRRTSKQRSQPALVT